MTERRADLPERRGDLRLSSGDRLRAWVVTGPIGRLAALVIEFGAALGRALGRR